MKVAIYGAGGHGRVVLDCLISQHTEVAGFLDDAPELAGRTVNGVAVLGNVHQVAARLREERVAVVPALGDNALRRRALEVLETLGLPVASAVHRRAVVSGTARLGAGTVVMPGGCVNANAVIGRGCIVNTGATVDHDSVLGDFVHLCPGCHLAGAVTVGDGALLGIGTCVIPQIRIGGGAVIGAGSTVVRDIPGECIAYGVPARVVRQGIMRKSEVSGA